MGVGVGLPNPPEGDVGLFGDAVGEFPKVLPKPLVDPFCPFVPFRLVVPCMPNCCREGW